MALDLVRLYDSIDLNKLDEFIDNQREEDLHLDFKRLNEPRMDRDDRKNFATALSGFANADGGIIIWGIDARPNPEGINCASGKIPIRPIQLAISRLNEFTGSHVNPSVDGVIHKAIDCEDDSGFAVTLIPSSDSTPHMAKGGEDRYYKRSGDRFIKMEHFDVEDMFGRRPRPILSLSYRVIQGRGRRGDTLPFFIILGLRNEGRGSARAPYLSIHEQIYQIYQYGLDGNGKEGLPRLTTARDSQWRSWGGAGDTVIHPSTNLDVLALEGTFDPAQPGFTDLSVEYKIAAEDMVLNEGTLHIDVNLLLQEIRRAWQK